MSQIISPQDHDKANKIVADFPKEQRLKRKVKVSPKADPINMIPPKGINTQKE